MPEKKRKYEAQIRSLEVVKRGSQTSRSRTGTAQKSKPGKNWKAPCTIETVYRIIACIEAL